MSLLGPLWLIKQIQVISLIIAATFLVIFSDAVNQFIVFPLADLLRIKSNKQIKSFSKRPIIKFLAKISSRSLATIIFLGYCWLGSFILAEYIFTPILSRLKNVILIIVVFYFLLISYIINNKKLRDYLMKF